MRVLRGLAAGVVMIAVATGCSDDSSDDAATPAEAAETTAGSDGGGSNEPASGEPIHLATIATPQNLEVTEAAVEVAVSEINARGGVNGRPLEVEVCDEGNDPNAATACARGFADDSSVVATVGMIQNYGGDTNPIFEAAGLAGVGTATASRGDWASPVVFPTTISALGTMGGSALLFDELDAPEIGLAMVDTPAGVAFEGFINDVILAPRSSEVAASVVIPLTAADLAPQAAALADADGIHLGLTPDLATRFVQASRQQGFAGPIVVAASQLSASQVAETLPGMTDELYAIGTYNYESDGWNRMLAEAEAHDVDPARVNDTFATTWLSLQLFAEVASGLETVDRASVLEAMNALSGFDTEGMTSAPLDYTVDGDVLGGAAPNIIPAIQQVFGYRFEDGAYVLVTEVSPFSA